MLIIPITLILLTIAALCDLKTRRIPNLITMPAILFGLILNLYYFGLVGLGEAFLGALTGILLLFLPFALGGMGAGDVKLLAVVGALNGMEFVFYSFLYSAITGGAIAVLLSLFRGQLNEVLLNTYWAFRNLPNHILKRDEGQVLAAVTAGIRFPYGAAILTGTFITYWVR